MAHRSVLLDGDPVEALEVLDVAGDDRGVDYPCHAGDEQIAHQGVDPVLLYVGIGVQIGLDFARGVGVLRRERQDPQLAEVGEQFLHRWIAHGEGADGDLLEIDRGSDEFLVFVCREVLRHHLGTASVLSEKFKMELVLKPLDVKS